MKLLKKSALLLALLSAVTVQAQTPAPQPTALPAAEMRTRREAMKQEIDGDLRHVLHLQALARKDKDVIKLTCVNDKLVQIKAQMNIFDSASLQLESNATSGDDPPRAAFAEIETASADIKKLRGEADGCAGALEMYRQESKSDVERPELDDPTDGGPFEPPEHGEQAGTELEPPGYATPYR
jgi:hypothetical protein